MSDSDTVTSGNVIAGNKTRIPSKTTKQCVQNKNSAAEMLGAFQADD